MANHIQCNMEFLDFNSIEDPEERGRVRAALNAISEDVQLPWQFIENHSDVDHEFGELESANHQLEHSASNSVSDNCTQHPITDKPSFDLNLPVLNNGPTPFVPHTQQNGTCSLANQTVPDQISAISNGSVPQMQENATSKTNGAPSKSWASLFRSGNSEAIENVCQSVNGNCNGFNGNNNNNGDFWPVKSPSKVDFVDPICYRMGEFLLSHKIDNRAVSLQPRGLINKSNYCYINSILQALIACPPMCNLLSGLARENTVAEKHFSTPVIDGICRFMKEFQLLPVNSKVNRRNNGSTFLNCDRSFEPTWIYRMLKAVRNFSFLNEGKQEDAEEFLGLLLNGLNDEMLALMNLVNSDSNVITLNDREEWQVKRPKSKENISRRANLEKTPIGNIFGGVLKSRIHKTDDDTVTENIQSFFTLQLNIKKVKTIHEALEALVSKNQLEGVISTKTNQEVEAWQQITLDELPTVLVMHLKCFDFKYNGCTKIVKPIEFPKNLEIDPEFLSAKPNMIKERQYKLFAVVYHEGEEAIKGHYTTDAFHVGFNKWLRYNDSSIKTVQEEHVLNPQGNRVPYLLFYRHTNANRNN